MIVLYVAMLCIAITFFAHVLDEPIRRQRGDSGTGPTGNWYIVHLSRPGSSTTHLNGHRTKRGAKREIVACKKHLPWAAQGEWVVRRAADWEENS